MKRVLCIRVGTVRQAHQGNRCRSGNTGLTIANCKLTIANCKLKSWKRCRSWRSIASGSVPRSVSSRRTVCSWTLPGLAHLFGGEAALVRQIAADFAGRGLAARMAVADTPAAAWALTHYTEDCKLQIENERLRFRLQFSICNSAIFNLAHLPPGETTAALHPLPVESLRLPPETVALLHQLGLYQIGQVEALPREELTARFGPRLLERLDQAAGRLARADSGPRSRGRSFPPGGRSNIRPAGRKSSRPSSNN